jgi:hypothetical protein
MRSVAVHAVLAVLGLAFAYQTWTRDEQEPAGKEEGQALILECEEGSLERFSIESPATLVSFAPQRSEGETLYWVTTQRKPRDAQKADATADEGAGDEGETTGAPAPDDAPSTDDGGAAARGALGAADAGAPGGDAEPTTRPAETKPVTPRPYDPDAPVEFLADGKKFQSVVDRLTPLRAVRSLGTTPADKVEVFGFDDIDTFLRIECGGKKLELGVGARTYGSGHRYAKRMDDEQTYLVDGRLLMDLQSARVKFMQTAPHAFEPTDVDAARVQARGLDKRLLLRNRKSKDASWVDAAEPDRRNELYGNWFQRLSRLKVKRYLDAGAGPGSDLQGDVSEPETVLTVDYELEGKPKGKLELVRVEAGGETFYYARTETTRRWTSMYDSIAKAVEQDVGLVVGAEEAPSEPEPPAESIADPAQPAAPAAPATPATPPGHPPIPAHGNPHAMPGGPMRGPGPQ